MIYIVCILGVFSITQRNKHFSILLKILGKHDVRICIMIYYIAIQWLNNSFFSGAFHFSMSSPRGKAYCARAFQGTAAEEDGHLYTWRPSWGLPPEGWNDDTRAQGRRTSVRLGTQTLNLTIKAQTWKMRWVFNKPACKGRASQAEGGK